MELEGHAARALLVDVASVEVRVRVDPLAVIAVPPVAQARRAVVAVRSSSLTVLVDVALVEDDARVVVGADPHASIPFCTALAIGVDAALVVLGAAVHIRAVAAVPAWPHAAGLAVPWSTVATLVDVARVVRLRGRQRAHLG